MGYPGTMLESWDQGEKLRVYRDGKEKCRSPAWHPHRALGSRQTKKQKSTKSKEASWADSWGTEAVEISSWQSSRLFEDQ